VSDFIGGLCGVIFIVLFIVISVSLTRNSIRPIEMIWKTFAQNEDLNYRPYFMVLPRINGNYRGFDLTLCQATEYDKGTTGNYALTIYLPVRMKFKLHIYYKKSIVLFSCGNIISTGDRLFDETFIVKATEPVDIKQIFTDELRRKLMDRKELINISIKDNIIYHSSSIITKDLQALHYMAETMREIGINITGQADISEKNMGEIPVLSSGQSAFFLPDGKRGRGVNITCPFCHKKVVDNTKYCIECGNFIPE